MPCHSSLTSFVLLACDDLLLAPADLLREVAQLAELAEVAQFDAAHRIWHDLTFLGVIGRRHAIEDFEAAQGSSAASSLVRHHAADGAPENAGGRAVVHEGSARVG